MTGGQIVGCYTCWSQSKLTLSGDETPMPGAEVPAAEKTAEAESELPVAGKEAVEPTEEKEDGANQNPMWTISLLKIRLKTGRHHQIRVQLAAANHPLLGDQKYADEKTLDFSRENGIRNVALCAAKLHFIHPSTKEKMEFQIPPKGLPFRLFGD